MKEILAVFFLLVVAVSCAQPGHEEYGNGVFYNPQPIT